MSSKLKPITAAELMKLSDTDAFELAFLAAERSMARAMPDVFPAQKIKLIIASKWNAMKGEAQNVSSKDLISALKALFTTVDYAGTSVDSYKWHLREDFASTMEETYRVALKLVQLKKQKTQRFYESVASILAQANDAAEEYAQWRQTNALSAVQIEIDHQLQDLETLKR